MQKSWNLAKRKKNLFTNFSKLEYVLLWPMFNFGLKVAQIWDLSSEIQVFETFAEASSRILSTWISDKDWSTFRWQLPIGHKRKHSSFENLAHKSFLCLPEFQIFWILAFFELKERSEKWKKFKESILFFIIKLKGCLSIKKHFAFFPKSVKNLQRSDYFGC